MAWIKTVEEVNADSTLKAIYAEQRKEAGALANILKIHSWRRASSKLIWSFIRQRCTRPAS